MAGWFQTLLSKARTSRTSLYSRLILVQAQYSIFPEQTTFVAMNERTNYKTDKKIIMARIASPLSHSLDAPSSFAANSASRERVGTHASTLGQRRRERAGRVVRVFRQAARASASPRGGENAYFFPLFFPLCYFLRLFGKRALRFAAVDLRGVLRPKGGDGRLERRRGRGQPRRRSGRGARPPRQP